MTRIRTLVLAIVGLLIASAIAGIAVASGGSSSNDPTHLTAYFSRTIGLYNGNDIRILGVKVGKIDSMQVVGTQVKVTMSLNGKNPLPAGVKAVVVPPSLVSDRYIELQPAYTGGTRLGNDAVLTQKSTAVPLEYDELFKNLDQLNRALGPQGANSKGALSRLISVGEKNLNGNGTELNQALGNFSQAISTLSGNRGNLFGTVRSLQKFTTTLAGDDKGVRALNSNLAEVGSQLAGERHDLGAALANLSTALSLVNQFVAQNKGTLTTDVHGLTKVSQTLQGEKEAITQVVDDAGEAVTNLSLAGDPKVATQERVNGLGVEPLDTKADVTQSLTATGKANAACQTISALFPPAQATKLCGLLSPPSGGGTGPVTLGKGKGLSDLLKVLG